MLDRVICNARIIDGASSDARSERFLRGGSRRR